MSICSFADETASDIFHGINSKAARRIPRHVWRSAQRKLSLIHTAVDARDFRLPGLNFEALTYTRPGYFSIRVNDQYRIIFQYEKGEAYDVSVEDFHGRS